MRLGHFVLTSGTWDVNYMQQFSTTSLFLISTFRICLLLGEVTAGDICWKNDSYLYFAHANKNKKGKKQESMRNLKRNLNLNSICLITSVLYKPNTDCFKLLWKILSASFLSVWKHQTSRLFRGKCFNKKVIPSIRRNTDCTPRANERCLYGTHL